MEMKGRVPVLVDSIINPFWVCVWGVLPRSSHVWNALERDTSWQSTWTLCHHMQSTQLFKNDFVLTVVTRQLHSDMTSVCVCSRTHRLQLRGESKRSTHSMRTDGRHRVGKWAPSLMRIGVCFVFACSCACEQVHVHICLYVEAKGQAQVFFFKEPFPCFLRLSHWPQDHQFSLTGWLVSPQRFSCFLPEHWHHKSVPAGLTFFNLCSGARTKVLTLVQQTLYQLGYISSPRASFKTMFPFSVEFTQLHSMCHLVGRGALKLSPLQWSSIQKESRPHFRQTVWPSPQFRNKIKNVRRWLLGYPLLNSSRYWHQQSHASHWPSC